MRKKTVDLYIANVQDTHFYTTFLRLKSTAI